MKSTPAHSPPHRDVFYLPSAVLSIHKRLFRVSVGGNTSTRQVFAYSCTYILLVPYIIALVPTFSRRLLPRTGRRLLKAGKMQVTTDIFFVESRFLSSSLTQTRNLERPLLLLFLLSLALLNPWVRGDGVGYYAFARAPLLARPPEARISDAHRPPR